MLVEKAAVGRSARNVQCPWLGSYLMNYAAIRGLFPLYPALPSSYPPPLFHHYVVVGIVDSPNAAGALFRYSLKY